jgi:hypothetical protein
MVGPVNKGGKDFNIDFAMFLVYLVLRVKIAFAFS